MSGSGGEGMDDKRDWFKVEHHSIPNIVVKIEKPKGWGEGYAVELALGILEDQYEKFYGKKYRSK